MASASAALHRQVLVRAIRLSGDALGGKNFYCATAEVRFPLPFIPEDMGFGGAIFADAGSVWGTDANAWLRIFECFQVAMMLARARG